jgi:hypothetical protein
VGAPRAGGVVSGDGAGISRGAGARVATTEGTVDDTRHQDAEAVACTSARGGGCERRRWDGDDARQRRSRDSKVVQRSQSSDVAGTTGGRFARVA